MVLMLSKRGSLKEVLFLFVAFFVSFVVFSPAVSGMAEGELQGGQGAGLEISSTAFPFVVSVTASPEDGGMVEGAKFYWAEQNVSVKAIPHEGYVFINWTESGKEVSREEEYTFRVTEDRYLVANFGDENDDPPAILPGDVNLDGVIDILDVTLTMRHVMELVSLNESGKEAADVNRDGVIDVRDVALIMRKALNIIDQFPPGDND